MASLRVLEPSVQPYAQWFVDVLEKLGFNVTITSTRRSLDEQAKLYDNYIHGRSKYPAAAPGKSTHGQGIAFDLHLEPPNYKLAGEIWEYLGFTWGGRFKDEIHFDFRPSR